MDDLGLDYLDLTSLDAYEHVPADVRDTYRFIAPKITALMERFKGYKMTTNLVENIRYTLMASGYVDNIYIPTTIYRNGQAAYLYQIDMVIRGIEDDFGGWVHGWYPMNLRVNLC